MFKKIIAFTLFALVAGGAYAADAVDENQAAALQLANAMHMTESIDAMMVQAQASNKKQIDQILEQLKQSVPNLPAPQVAEVRAAAEIFLGKVVNSWSSAEAAKIYSENLTKSMSAKALKESVQFYNSPEGQNALASIAAAQQQMVTYVTSSQEKAMGPAYATFMAEIKKIMAPKAK